MRKLGLSIKNVAASDVETAVNTCFLNWRQDNNLSLPAETLKNLGDGHYYLTIDGECSDAQFGDFTNLLQMTFPKEDFDFSELRVENHERPQTVEQMYRELMHGYTDC